MAWPLIIFFTLFFVELPDKTSLVSLTFATRYPPLWVWLAASAALVAQTMIGLVAGRLLALVPHRALTLVESLLFLGFAIWIWKESRQSSENSSTLESPADSKLLRALPRIFGLVFAAEFMDLTQMATITFAAAHPRALWMVGCAAALALIAANGAVVGFGRILTSRIRAVFIQRAAAGVFALISLSLLSSVSPFHVL